MSIHKILLILLEVNISILFYFLNVINLSDIQFSGENNQFKRGSDQRGSPFKKRQFVQQITPPIHTGLFRNDLKSNFNIFR
jgi:hypothetical protein